MLSQRDPESLVGRHWRQENPAAYSAASIAPEGIVDAFCADCPPDLAAELLRTHRAEPALPRARGGSRSGLRSGSAVRGDRLGTRERATSPRPP